MPNTASSTLLLGEAVANLISLQCDPHNGLFTWDEAYQNALGQICDHASRLLKPTSKSVFLVGTHRYHFRAGEPLLVIGVKMVAPPACEPRPCYEVLARDGASDFIAIRETTYYKLISLDDVVAGRIPPVDC